MVQRMSGAHRTGSSRLYLLFKSETEAWVPGPWCGSEWAWLHGAYDEGYLGEALLRMWRRMPVLTQPYDLWRWWQWCGEDRRPWRRHSSAESPPGVTVLFQASAYRHGGFWAELTLAGFLGKGKELLTKQLHWSWVSFLFDLFFSYFLFYVETDHDYFMIYLEAYLTDHLWFSFI